MRSRTSGTEERGLIAQEIPFPHFTSFTNEGIVYGIINECEFNTPDFNRTLVREYYALLIMASGEQKHKATSYAKYEVAL